MTTSFFRDPSLRDCPSHVPPSQPLRLEIKVGFLHGLLRARITVCNLVILYNSILDSC